MGPGPVELIHMVQPRVVQERSCAHRRQVQLQLLQPHSPAPQGAKCSAQGLW